MFLSFSGMKNVLSYFFLFWSRRNVEFSDFLFRGAFCFFWRRSSNFWMDSSRASSGIISFSKKNFFYFILQFFFNFLAVPIFSSRFCIGFRFPLFPFECRFLRHLISCNRSRCKHFFF